MHFAVLVVGEDTYDALSDFDENLEVRHIVSKEELIENEKRGIEFIFKSEERYRDDPEGYKAEYKRNEEHYKFMEEEVPKMRKWSDDEWYQYAIRHVNKDELTEDGGFISYYNPDSKYDWFQVGGRWSDSLKIKKDSDSHTVGERAWTLDNVPHKRGYADSALKKDVDWDHESMKDFYLYAFLKKNGEWIDSDGYTGEEWKKKFEKLLADVDDYDRITVVDCHI
jgi:hypothetical protein